MPWQIAEGEYTDICPDALIRGSGHIHTVWKRTLKFGLPHDKGWMQQPARWWQLITICDDEYGKQNAK